MLFSRIQTLTTEQLVQDMKKSWPIYKMNGRQQDFLDENEILGKTYEKKTL
jgi:hypothetical protein